MRDLIKALEAGSDALAILAVRDAEARAKLGRAQEAVRRFREERGPDPARAAEARVRPPGGRAARGRLRAAAERGRPPAGGAAGGEVGRARWSPSSSSRRLLVLVLVADGPRVPRGLATQRRAMAETENKTNQEAILRLLNEMGDLADGDLTVKAEVTEDITGAIADSMNYTIDELRNLVTGVNSAAISVTAEDGAGAVDFGGAARRRGTAVEGDRGDDLAGAAGVALDLRGVDDRGRRRAGRAALARRRRQGPRSRCRTRSRA